MSALPVGTYYYLSVVPIKGGSNVELFDDTYWACVDYFFQIVELRKKVTIPERFLHGEFHALSLESCSHGESQVGGESVSAPTYRGRELQCSVKKSLIGDSYASKVTGRRKIDVNSYTTEYQYEINKPSAHCILGLSVQPKLEFLPKATTKSLIVEAKETIAHYLEGQHKHLLEKITKTYISEECCICLDDAPNTVFYQCGHQCCHYECCSGESVEITKCPMCRKHIAAKIKV